MPQITNPELNQICLDTLDTYQVSEPTLYALLQLLYFTGLRSVEVLETSRWSVSSATTYSVQLSKNEGSRTINRSVVPELLRPYYDEHGSFGVYTYSALAYSLKKALPTVTTNSDTRPVTSHLFRYNKMRGLSDQGFTDSQIQAIMGHESLESTYRYVHDQMFASSIPPTPTRPDQLANLAYWFESDQLTLANESNEIIQWGSLGNKNTQAVQSGSTPGPLLSDFTCNGYPVFDFTTILRGLSFPKITPANFTLFAVTYNPSGISDNRGRLVGGVSGTDPLIFFSSGLSEGLSFGAWESKGALTQRYAVGPPFLDSWDILGLRNNRLLHNGVEPSYAESDNLGAGSMEHIGYRSGPTSDGSKGYIAAIIIYTRQLSNAEMTQVSDYLNSKYNIY